MIAPFGHGVFFKSIQWLSDVTADVISVGFKVAPDLGRKRLHGFVGNQTFGICAPSAGGNWQNEHGKKCKDGGRSSGSRAVRGKTSATPDHDWTTPQDPRSALRLRP